ncbi:hypothetical protein Vadar_000009 [Vaccinium darrowii]|uniref:Uncharacterized protein n=1 Tax=Vaccinium darrowii TaxID=229202 RepID=A0ACB7Z1G4_9ERIC|nr:hypothetical protein Vadar_000009 [Vaccinium darrowii]
MGFFSLSWTSPVFVLPQNPYLSGKESFEIKISSLGLSSSENIQSYSTSLPRTNPGVIFLGFGKLDGIIRDIRQGRGLILVIWQLKFHHTNTQLWMVPVGLIILITPVIVCVSSIVSDLSSPNKDDDQGGVSSLNQPGVMSTDNSVQDLV